MKKIALVVYNSPFGNSPSLINLVRSLAKDNFQVDVYIDEHSIHEVPVALPQKNINIFPIFRIKPFREKYDPGFFGFIKKIDWQLQLFRGLIHFRRYLKDRIDQRYSYIIGAGVFGLILVAPIAQRNKIPLIYYSLELFISKEIVGLKNKIIKFYEKKYSRLSRWIIIQDRSRARTMSRDNLIPMSNFIYIPVSNLGTCRVKKTNYLYRSLKIPRNKKIILYAGELARWAMIEELVKAANVWDDDLVFVIHASRINANNFEYLKSLQKLALPGRIYFSFKQLNLEALIDLVSSAHIGLVFYREISTNFKEIGKSSGKLAVYLQSGLPVITSNSLSLKRVIKKFNCGRCVASPQEIEKGTRKIFLRYNSYRHNACEAFKKFYSYEQYYRVLSSKINEITINKDPIDYWLYLKILIHKIKYTITVRFGPYLNPFAIRNIFFFYIRPETARLENNVFDWRAIVRDLKKEGIGVRKYRISKKDFIGWFKTMNYPDFYRYEQNKNFMEKALEHYLSICFLKPNAKDILLDVASKDSPFYKLVEKSYGTNAYALDICFKRGIVGKEVGADATKTPFPDNYFSKITLHCAFEVFEGDDDINFINEAVRILKPGGKMIILPLYFHHQHLILRDPKSNNWRLRAIEKEAKVVFVPKLGLRFCRHYSVRVFIKRIVNHLGDLKLKIFYVENEKEISQASYMKFIALFQK